MPFFETALFGDHQLTHIASVRMRVIGVGDLQTVVKTINNVRNIQLANIPMQLTNGREPAILANFTTQKIKLRIFTDQINEVLHVTRVIMFVKPIYTGRPQ